MVKLESITQREVTKQKKYGLKEFLKPSPQEKAPLIILSSITTLPLAGCGIAAYMNNVIDEKQFAIWLGASTLIPLFTYLRCRFEELDSVKKKFYLINKGFHWYE